MDTDEVPGPVIPFFADWRDERFVRPIGAQVRRIGTRAGDESGEKRYFIVTHRFGFQ